VVKIELHKRPHGSGVVISKYEAATGGCKLAVLTAHHVAGIDAFVEPLSDDAGHAAVIPLMDITVDGYSPSSIALRQGADVALVIFLIPKPCTAVPYTAAEMDATPLTLGDQLVHIGFPAGEPVYATGVYIHTANGHKGFNWPNVGSVTSVAGPGSSGGAIFHKGKLVGILVGGELSPPFRNYFVHIRYAFTLMP